MDRVSEKERLGERGPWRLKGGDWEKQAGGEKFRDIRCVKGREEGVDGDWKPEKIWGDREGDADLKRLQAFYTEMRSKCWLSSPGGYWQWDAWGFEGEGERQGESQGNESEE